MRVVKDPPQLPEGAQRSYFAELMSMLGFDAGSSAYNRQRDNLNDALDVVGTYALANPVSQATIEALRPIWAPYVFRNYRPYDYPNIESLVDDTITALRGQRAEPELDPEGRLNAGEEAFSMALGLPTKNYYFTESPYRPSNSSDKSMRYYRFNPDLLDKQTIREKYGDAEVGQQLAAREIYDLLNSSVGEDEIGADPLENFKISIGMDDKGKYASLYDKYDFSGPANYMIRPFEIYDRVYFDQ